MAAAATATMEVPPVSYLLPSNPAAMTREVDESSAPRPQSEARLQTPRMAARYYEQNVGLGFGPGGSLARSCLVSVGAGIVEPSRKLKAHESGGGEEEPPPGAKQKIGDPGQQQSTAALAPGDRTASLPLRPSLVPEIRKFLPEGAEAAAAARKAPKRLEPQGLLMGLLLNDNGLAERETLVGMGLHRWLFQGALEIAEKSKGYCLFVWCLLELQQNVQTDEEGDALEPKLVRACTAFVASECRQGRMNDMYQVLTHFICNSLVFYEWDKFLRLTFEDSRANQEIFLVPHVEQVWTRFMKLSGALQRIFGGLDERFAWVHRLPKVSELLHEHMRRRCFSSDLVARNELFQQATIKDETLKQVKSAFGFT